MLSPPPRLRAGVEIVIREYSEIGQIHYAAAVIIATWIGCQIGICEYSEIGEAYNTVTIIVRACYVYDVAGVKDYTLTVGTPLQITTAAEIVIVKNDLTVYVGSA